MKIDYRIGGLITSIAAGVLFASSALAYEGGMANEGYVGDSTGMNVRDSSGDCVRTSSWKAEDMTVECGAEPPAPEVVSAPPPPPPPPVIMYEKTTMSATTLFDFDKAVLKEEGKVALHELDDEIKAKGAKVVDIDVIGHTDSTGPEDYNLDLSVRRAQAVADYIISEGIDASIIDVSGEGESNPIASNATREGRAENRRVDIHVGVEQPAN
ncbi:MAG: OmpA family protein [Gammaproteobacteria bacterium]|nr:OmpA family protein [Gammaproteobacteria bacterium]